MPDRADNGDIETWMLGITENEMDCELLTIKETSRDVLKQSERKTWKDIATGRFGPAVLRLGRCVRVRADELRDWIDAGCPSREEWLSIRGPESEVKKRRRLSRR